jgi:hypothetical protein
MGVLETTDDPRHCPPLGACVPDAHERDGGSARRVEERVGNAHLPEMIHGHNALQCTHEATGTCLRFDALHGLRGWVVRASLHTCVLCNCPPPLRVWAYAAALLLMEPTATVYSHSMHTYRRLNLPQSARFGVCCAWSTARTRLPRSGDGEALRAYACLSDIRLKRARRDRILSLTHTAQHTHARSRKPGCRESGSPFSVALVVGQRASNVLVRRADRRRV